MTLTDCRNGILELLAHQDVITPSDFATIEIDPEVEDQREALIRSVLGDLVEAGMLRVLPADPALPLDNSLWILTAPLGVSGQEVSISLPTAIHVTSEINAFIDAFEKEWPRPDALAIGEHNVLMLLAMLNELRDMGDDDGDGERGFGGGDEGRN